MGGTSSEKVTTYSLHSFGFAFESTAQECQNAIVLANPMLWVMETLSFLKSCTLAGLLSKCICLFSPEVCEGVSRAAEHCKLNGCTPQPRSDLQQWLPAVACTHVMGAGFASDGLVAGTPNLLRLLALQREETYAFCQGAVSKVTRSMLMLHN